MDDLDVKMIRKALDTREKRTAVKAIVIAVLISIIYTSGVFSQQQLEAVDYDQVEKIVDYKILEEKTSRGTNIGGWSSEDIWILVNNNTFYENTNPYNYTNLTWSNSTYNESYHTNISDAELHYLDASKLLVNGSLTVGERWIAQLPVVSFWGNLPASGQYMFLWNGSDGSLASGREVTATSAGIALGDNASASGSHGVAIGLDVNNSANQAFCFGSNVNCSFSNSYTFGTGIENNEQAFKIGWGEDDFKFMGDNLTAKERIIIDDSGTDLLLGPGSKVTTGYEIVSNGSVLINSEDSTGFYINRTSPTGSMTFSIEDASGNVSYILTSDQSLQFRSPTGGTVQFRSGTNLGFYLQDSLDLNVPSGSFFIDQDNDGLVVGEGQDAMIGDFSGTDLDLVRDHWTTDMTQINLKDAPVWIEENLTVADTIIGTQNWTHINYPAACAAGTAVTTIGDDTTCTAFLQNTSHGSLDYLTVVGNASIGGWDLIIEGGSSHNMFFGPDSFDYRQGVYNLGIGEETGMYNNDSRTSETGRYNVYLGYQAGKGSEVNNNSGFENVAIGFVALRDNTEGYRQIAIGKDALRENEKGNSNVAIGSGSMRYNLIGSGNFAFGRNAMYYHNSSGSNLAIGTASMFYNDGVGAYGNTAVGTYSLFGISNTQTSDNDYNTALGYYAGRELGTGDRNTLLGSRTGYSLNNSHYNVFIGNDAGYHMENTNYNFIVDIITRTDVEEEKDLALLYGHFDTGDDADTQQWLDVNGYLGINKSEPTYPLEVNMDVGDISIWARKNVSAAGYTTRTSVYDKSKGSALDYIKDASDYSTNGEINHSKFYGFTQYTVPDKSRPVPALDTIEECSCVRMGESSDEEDSNIICLEFECKNNTIETVEYPYTKTETGISLNAEIDVLRQAVYEQQQIIEGLEKRVADLEEKVK